jgi:hypothetical protein
VCQSRFLFACARGWVIECVRAVVFLFAVIDVALGEHVGWGCV